MRNRNLEGPFRGFGSPFDCDDWRLTFYVQKDSPGKARESNWLPAPDGPIYLVMRLYWRKKEPPSVLPPGDGTWKPPAIVPSSQVPRAGAQTAATIRRCRRANRPGAARTVR
jgi:hypothetical protein